jgi:hypothetical protein
MPPLSNDPDVQGLTNIIQSVLASPAVEDTVRKIAELRMKIYDLQEELRQLETNLPEYIQTVIITPPEEPHADSV